MPPSLPWRTGQWNEARDGFFNVDERLRSSWLFPKSGLKLPLAPTPIFMPEFPTLNHTVVELVGYSEQYIRERFLDLFRTSCRHRHGGAHGAPFLFVDSGSNEGTWSLLAAAHGCKVVAVDPQPLCIRMLGAAANRSGLARSIELHNNVIAPDSMHSGAMSVPTDQCHGTAEFKAANQEVSDVTREGRSYLHRHTPRVPVAPISMDALIGPSRTVSLWHLDVEGAEVPVLRSARRLFAERRVRRVMLEFIPMRWPAQNVSQNSALAELAGLFADWQCVVACPDYPEHHLAPFKFTLQMVRTHIQIKSKSTCENLLCVDPLVQTRPDAV